MSTRRFRFGLVPLEDLALLLKAAAPAPQPPQLLALVAGQDLGVAGGGFYGYKLDMAVCSATGLPVAWDVRTAKENEANHARPLIDVAQARGFAAETCAMDRGYDYTAIYEGCAERDCLPVIPLRQTPAVKQGKHKPPTCEHGE